MAEAGRFVGRGAELAALGGALSAARAGSGALVLIAGEPGIGKTALTASFADRARGAGVRVASGSAWEWGGAPPFWPWAQVLRALGRHPGGRGAHPEPADPLLELGQRSGEPGAGARFAVFDAVVERLREEAEKSALLVLLDDLHAADVPSLLLLRFAAEQLRDAPVLVVGTWRTLGASPPAQVADLLTELGRVARVLELTGLSADELAELQSARGTSGAPGDLHERTGGNPLLADALLGERDDDVELPRRARATVERRIAGLSEPARALLAAAAVIGRDVPLALLARVAARPLAEVLDHVHALEAERILIARHGASGGHGFRHGLFREVVYAGLSPAARLSLHRAAGAALEAQHGGEPDVLPELARHFLAIAPDPRGVDHAVAAGEHAMRSTAYEDAASLFERALGALAAGAPDPGRAAAVAVRLGDAQAAAGAIAAARETYRRARAAAIAASDGSALVGAALGFARVAGFGRTDDESVEWLRHALAESPAPPERVRLLAALVDRTWMAAGSRAEESAREAVELARETSDPRLLGEALAAGLIMSWGPAADADAQRERAGELLAIADTAGEPELSLEAQRWRFTLAMIHGAVGEARQALDVYERQAARLARPQLRLAVLLRRFMLACLDGHYAVAAALPDAIQRAGERAGDPQTPFIRAFLDVQLHRARGRTDELEHSLDRLRATARDNILPSVVSAVAAAVHAQLGRPDQARRELAAHWDGADDMPWTGRPIALAFATWAAWLLGARADAERLVPLLRPYQRLVLMGGAVEFLGPGSLYLGLARATVGDLDAAAGHLETAIDELDRIGARPQAARARHALARVIARTEPGRSDRLRAEARAAAQAMGGLWLGDPIESAAAPSIPSPDAPADGLFALEGDTYAVALDGGVARIKRTKGLDYIERLLRSEGTELHVLDLAGAALDDRNGDPLVDERARAAYRERVEDLREQLAEAERFGDTGRATRARDELDLVAAELSRTTGLGGRLRTSGTAERARSSVTLAIRRAIKALSEVHPALGAHLDAALSTGAFCVYRPEPRARVTWRFGPHVAS